jgi:hypothetical protein
LSRWDFQPFTPQQRGDAPITIAAIGTGQPDDCCAQRRFIILDQVGLALGRARLADGAAGPPFRYRKPLLQMYDTLAPAFRA